MKKKIKKLKKKAKYLKKWLGRFHDAQEVAPIVQMNLESTEWQIEALENQPEEASEIPDFDLRSQIFRDYKQLPHALPMLPIFKIEPVYNTMSTGTSSTATTYEFVTRVGDIETPGARDYSKIFVRKYHKLQENQSREKNVRNLISKLENKQTLERFDRAQKAHSLFKVGTEPRTSAANEMRNLLSGIKGDLEEKARNWGIENMTWEKMADRLTRNEINKNEIINQKKTHSSLLSRLADVLKDREGGSITNLDYIWPQVLDHLFIILNSIDAKYMK